MSQIQNQTLHSIVQPLLFLGSSMLAGRAVQFFPGGSPGGFLLQGGLAAACTYGSRCFAPENKSRMKSLMRTLASIAVATIAAPALGKMLNGRADISMRAACRLGLIQSVIAGGVAYFSSDLLVTDLLDTYNTYKDDKNAWTELKKEERTELVKQFYEANLAPFATPEEASYETDIFTRRDFDQMSEAQLKWHVAVVPNDLEFPSADLINLNTALHAKELPLNFFERLENRELFMEMIDNHKELLIAYCLQDPFFYGCGHVGDKNVHKLCRTHNLEISHDQIEKSLIKHLDKYSADQWMALSDEHKISISKIYDTHKLQMPPLFLVLTYVEMDLDLRIDPTIVTSEVVAFLKKKC